MAGFLSTDLILPPTVAVVAGVVSAYVSNLWYRKSTREEFRREQAWGRKYEAFHRLLMVLDEGHDMLYAGYLVLSGEFDEIVDKSVKSMTRLASELPGPEAEKFLSDLRREHFHNLGILLLHLDPNWSLNQASASSIVALIERRRMEGISRYLDTTFALDILGVSSQTEKAGVTLLEQVVRAEAHFRTKPPAIREDWKKFDSAWSKQLKNLRLLIKEELAATEEDREVKELELPVVRFPEFE